MNIQTTDKFLDSYGIKMLLVGESGSGKTRSVATLQKAGYKPLLISAESGVRSLAGNPIPMIDISKNDKGEDLPMEKRFDRLGEVYAWLKKGQSEYDTIFVDSLTEINAALIIQLKQEIPDAKDTLKVYMANSEKMVKLVRAFRDLPYNVVLVSLSEVEKDELGKRFTTASVVGKVAQHLPALMDEVIHIQVVEDENKKISRRFQCGASSGIVCKDRSGMLNTFEPADLGQLFNKILGKNK